MTRLAHFSDLHVGIDDDDVARFEWLFADALERGADHIVIAGDVLDHGNLEDLRPLKAALRRVGLWHPDRLTVVPGNHDIIGASPHHKLGVFTDTTAKRVVRRRKFRRAFHPLEVGARREGSGYPFLKIVGALGLVGIDTTKPDSFTEGLAGATQIERVEKLVRWAADHHLTPVVVAHHRPIDIDVSDTPWHYRLWSKFTRDSMNLIDGRALLGAIGEGGGDLILCGHWHVLDDEEHYERSSGVRVHTQGRSGGMDQADEGDGIYYSYDLLDIGTSSVRRRTIEFEIDEIDCRIVAGNGKL